MPHKTAISTEMTQCIEQCLACHTTCQQTALQHCLELGGDHVEPGHFRLMLDCAEVCRASAALMINGSPYHTEQCRLCAQICRACAASCAELDDMEDCVQSCERCAESCEAMAAQGPQAGKARHSGAAARTQ